jgi:hypothetical protein
MNEEKLCSLAILAGLLRGNKVSGGLREDLHRWDVRGYSAMLRCHRKPVSVEFFLFLNLALFCDEAWCET